MDCMEYLKSYGWKEGEALRKGGLKRSILVRHKNDRKGLGASTSRDDTDTWWERMFNGQLKNLNVNINKSEGITFKQNESVDCALSKERFRLYDRFYRGDDLEGTIKTKNKQENVLVLVKNGSRKKQIADSTHLGKKKSKRSKKDSERRDRLKKAKMDDNKKVKVIKVKVSKRSKETEVRKRSKEAEVRKHQKSL